MLYTLERLRMKSASTCLAWILTMIMPIKGTVNKTTMISVADGKWCTHETSMLMAVDLNGNGYDEVVCHDGTGRHWQIDDSVFAQSVTNGACFGSYEAGSSKYREDLIGWCVHSGATRHYADFNADGRIDVLCHDMQGQFFISLVDSNGNFGPQWYRPLGWCTGSSGKLHVGDFNGDHRADVLCQEVVDGRLWVKINKANVYFESSNAWFYPGPWCNTPGEEFFIADFNGDTFDDIFCNAVAGKAIALSKTTGTTFNEIAVASQYVRKTGFCEGSEDFITVGYLNEDRYADLICLTKSGATLTHINHPTSRFDLPFSQPFSFCPGETSRLLVGRFIDSETQQLLCARNPDWQILSGFV